MQSSPQNAFV